MLVALTQPVEELIRRQPRGVPVLFTVLRQLLRRPREQQMIERLSRSADVPESSTSSCVVNVASPRPAPRPANAVVRAAALRACGCACTHPASARRQYSVRVPGKLNTTTISPSL